jgi:hypothetical protein
MSSQISLDMKQVLELHSLASRILEITDPIVLGLNPAEPERLISLPDLNEIVEEKYTFLEVEERAALVMQLPKSIPANRVKVINYLSLDNFSTQIPIYELEGYSQIPFVKRPDLNKLLNNISPLMEGRLSNIVTKYKSHLQKDIWFKDTQKSCRILTLENVLFAVRMLQQNSNLEENAPIALCDLEKEVQFKLN